MAQITLNSTGVASNGTLALQSNGTTTAVTIDASQNVGIGTASPTYPLTVQANSTTQALRIIGRATGNLANVSFVANNGSTEYAFINTGPTFFAIGVNGAEAARIDSSGNLLVGDTTTIGTGGKFQVKSSTDTALFKCTSATTFAAIISNVENTSARLMAFQYGSGGSPTNVGTITTNGTGVTYGTSSDYRLKNTIAPMTGALAKVALLKPCTYKWNVDGSDGQGFIAHELQEVIEGCVTGEKDAVDAEGKPQYQGIDTSFLVATLTAAIQEQQALITTLTARITALEGA